MKTKRRSTPKSQTARCAHINAVSAKDVDGAMVYVAHDVVAFDVVAAGSQNGRVVKTILLAAAALVVLTGCQSAVEKQRLEEADSGDLPSCARIREVSGGCGKNSGLAEVYVDNMHKNRAVQVTLRKHSQEGDDDTDYAIAEGGQLFVGCGGGGTSFTVVGCKLLKGKAKKM